MKFRINYKDENSIQKLSKALLRIITELNTEYKPITIFCIGTDKCIGDALGPLVGTMLSEKELNAKVIGTLNDPVHAVNMHEKIKLIDDSSFVIAIDAAVSEGADIIEVRDSGIKPGAAVNKKLPKVGDISLCSVLIDADKIVDVYHVLKTYRLAKVYEIAKIITESIVNTLEQYIINE